MLNLILYNSIASHCSRGSGAFVILQVVGLKILSGSELEKAAILPCTVL